MAPSSRDRISVDLRGLKVALVERTRARGTTPSELVRALLADVLGQRDPSITRRLDDVGSDPANERVRVSLRMSKTDAQTITRAASAAGLSLGAYLAGLVAGVPVLALGAQRGEHITALAASCAEMSTLCRNINRLTSLLQQGSGRAAQEYRAMLDTVAQDVRNHLVLASAVLVDLRPRRGAAAADRAPRA